MSCNWSLVDWKNRSIKKTNTNNNKKNIHPLSLNQTARGTVEHQSRIKELGMTVKTLMPEIILTKFLTAASGSFLETPRTGCLAPVRPS